MSGKEYFLLENREATGKDEEIPGEGLLSRFLLLPDHSRID